MKTKDDLIQQYSIGCAYGQAEFTFPELYKLMDEFAKQQSKEFLVWADSNSAREGMQSWSIGAGRTMKVYTTGELYDLFIETQQNNG